MSGSVKIMVSPCEGQGAWVRIIEILFDHAVADCDCHECGHTPLRVRGESPRISSDDQAYESDGRCFDCGSAIGLVRAEMETMFGLREDEAVVAEIEPRGGKVYR